MDFDKTEKSMEPGIVNQERDEYVYVGFWKRVIAYLIDAMLLFPVMYFIYPSVVKFSIDIKSAIPYLIYNLATYLLVIVFVVKLGGSPGMLILKVRIVNGKGQYISFLSAVIRIIFILPNLVVGALKLAHSIPFLTPEKMPKDLFHMGSAFIIDINKYNLIDNICLALVLIDVLVIVFNKKKRAIHDFIAGTYVVTKESLFGFNQNKDTI